MTIYAIQVYKRNTAILLYQTFRKTLKSAQIAREAIKNVFIECYVTIETYQISE